MSPHTIIDRAASGARLSSAESLALAEASDLAPLMRAAAERRDTAHGDLVSYSRKVFIPLTHLCRDVCHYCTFATPPRRGAAVRRVRAAVRKVAGKVARKARRLRRKSKR